MSDAEQAEWISALAAAGVAPDLRSALARFGASLLRASARTNLTGAKTREALIPHLMDSLAVVPYVRENLVDIGSGGGLPAVPLAIATQVPITMIEATAKKTAYLSRASAELGLAATVLTGRAERLAFEEAYRERFMTATARAVAVAPTVLEFTMPFLVIGGKAILQRGSLDDRERRATADAALVLGGELIEEISLDGVRRLLVIEKQRPTPLRFPRRTGVPVKRPLCLD